MFGINRYVLLGCLFLASLFPSVVSAQAYLPSSVSGVYVGGGYACTVGVGFSGSYGRADVGCYKNGAFRLVNVYVWSECPRFNQSWGLSAPGAYNPDLWISLNSYDQFTATLSATFNGESTTLYKVGNVVTGYQLCPDTFFSGPRINDR